MRALNHPDYVYRPMPEAVRRKLSLLHRRRLGIPDGYRRLCGVDMPEVLADHLKPVIHTSLRSRNPQTRKLARAVLRGLKALLEKKP